MLTHDDLSILATVSGPCLTIFQPLREDCTHAVPAETRIVAAIQEADRLLEKKGFDPANRQQVLRSLIKVASNTDWTRRRGSLVMFGAPGFSMSRFWPDRLVPRVHFAQGFLVLPLLPTILSNRDFWLLALSINAVHLFRSSGNGPVEIALPPGVPKSLLEAGDLDRPDHSLRGRSSAGPPVGRMRGVHFGTSSGHDAEVAYLQDFFKAIDQGIHSILAGDRQPLILAGATRELAIYRKTNTYSLMLTGAVHGSLGALGVHALYAKAFDLMLAFSARTTDAALLEMEAAASHGLLATDPVPVAEAAAIGQVEELIVSPATHGFEQCEDPVNGAALATIRNSGRVVVLSDSQLATGVAAVLRFRQTQHNGDEIT